MQPPTSSPSLRPHLDGALVATDFDGTLAPLQRDPEDSRPVAGTIEALTALAERGAQLAVITGRDARTVVRLGGLDAVPGLDRRRALRRRDLDRRRARHAGHPAGHGAAARAAARRAARRRPGGVDRGQAAVAGRARPARRRPAGGAGRGARAGRRPSATSWASRCTRAAGCSSCGCPATTRPARWPRSPRAGRRVLFLGDDLGDLPAFEQIRRIRAARDARPGASACSPPGPTAIAEAADVTVDDPAAIVDLLRGPRPTDGAADGDRRVSRARRAGPGTTATGGSRTAAARIRSARSAPLVAVHRQRLVQRRRRWRVTSNGFTCSASSPSTSAAPVSRESTTAGDALGQHQPLEHDQVHPVADGVDEHDVAAAHDGQRRRVVVADVEDQRRPVVGAELVVDLLGQPLDARGVLAVGREVLARGVVEHRVHDPPAPLGAGAQQLAVGEQAAPHVLGQLGAVDPADDRPVADDVLEHAQRAVDAAAPGRAGASRRRRCRAGTPRHPRRSTPATARAVSRNRSAQRSVWKPMRSAPSMPSTIGVGDVVGQHRRSSPGVTHGVWVNSPIRTSGRSSRSIRGTRNRW